MCVLVREQYTGEIARDFLRGGWGGLEGPAQQ